MRRLEGKTILISGASRGIGLAIACACGAQGARVALLAKTVAPHPRLPGTLDEAAEAVRAAGGQALPIPCDIRDEAAVEAAVARAVETFGGLDAVVNNASAISLTGTADTDLKRFDLMTGVNSRGTYAVTRACLPHLLRSDRPHILTISPPLDAAPRWLKGHPAYTLAKYGMTLLTLGWAAEFAGRIAANCLWPRTAIDTAAVRNLLGGEAMAAMCRKPAIMADAAVAALSRGADFSGWCLLDDLMLAAEGVVDFEPYAVTPGGPLAPDFFVPEGAPAPQDGNGMVGWRAPVL
ncbi:MAG: SDR family oxidoreductase [Rubrimonas sp.]